MTSRLNVMLTVFLPALLGVLAACFVNEGAQFIVTAVLLFGIFAAAFDLAYGVTGIFSFGHAAFFGSGAYAYAILSMNHQWPFAPAFAASLVVGGVLALLFGLVSFRATGLYLALITLALGQLVNSLVDVKLRDLTGGSDGMAGVPRPVLFGHEMSSSSSFLIMVCVVFALVMTLLALIRNSAYGQVLRAIRDNPIRTGQLGYDVSRYRLSAYALSGALSGMAGALFSSLTLFVSPDLTKWTLSGDVLIMTVLGGAGTLAGPVLGVVLFELAKEIISRYTEHWYGVLGAMFIAMTLLLPGGIAGLGESWRKARRKRDPS